jgi:hypothetical protein
MSYSGRETYWRTNVDSRVFELIKLRAHIDTTVVGGVVAVDRCCVPAIVRVVLRNGVVAVGCESDSFVASSAAVGHAVARYSRCGC